MKTTVRKAGFAGVVALTLVTAACGSSSSTKAAASGGAASGSAACPNGKIRMGVEPYEDAAKLTPAYQALATAIGKGMGCTVDVQIVSDYAAEVLAMKNGQLEIAEFGPLGYVFADQEADAQPVASFANADGSLSSYTAGIWVPTASPIKTISDLKGKKLALSSAGSTSGDALPRQAIKKAGLSATDVTLQYAGGHAQSLAALTAANSKVDAGEINSQEMASAIAAGTFDPSKYREIYTSAPIPNDPVTVWGKLDPAFRTKLATVMTGLPASDVAAIGKYLDVDPAGPMIAVTKDTYKPLFDLATDLGLTEKDV